MPSAIVTELIEKVAKLEAKMDVAMKWMYFSVGTALTTLIAVILK